MNDSIIVSRIFSRLAEINMKQNTFADKIGVKQSVVTDWKMGRNKSYMNYLDVIANVLGVTPQYFYGFNQASNSGQHWGIFENREPRNEENASAHSRDVYTDLFKTFSKNEVEQLSRLSRDQAARVVQLVDEELKK